jgi:hypothetical protein
VSKLVRERDLWYSRWKRGSKDTSDESATCITNGKR